MTHEGRIALAVFLQVVEDMANMDAEAFDVLYLDELTAELLEEIEREVRS